jgi:hypothetical protein
MYSWQRFFSFCGLYLHLVTVSLLGSFLVWCSFICQSFVLIIEPFECSLETYCLCINVPVFYIAYFFRGSFNLSGPSLRSLIYFKLMLVQDERQGSSFRLLCIDSQFYQKHFWREYILKMLYILWSFVKKDLCLGCLLHFIGFRVSFVPIPWCFYFIVV